MVKVPRRQRYLKFIKELFELEDAGNPEAKRAISYIYGREPCGYDPHSYLEELRKQANAGDHEAEWIADEIMAEANLVFEETERWRNGQKDDGAFALFCNRVAELEESKDPIERLIGKYTDFDYFEDLSKMIADETRDKSFVTPEKEDKPKAPTHSIPLPENIKLAKIDSLDFGKDCKKSYRDFSEDIAREILRQIPEAWEDRENEFSPGSWGPRYVAKRLTRAETSISNHLRVLYNLGVRSVEKIYLPYRPKNSTE